VCKYQTPIWSCIGFLSCNESSTNCLLVHKALIGQASDDYEPAHAGHQHCITRFAVRLQQRRPLPTKNRAANWWPCILCRRTLCVESPTDRTETHAVVDSNIQAPSEVFFFARRTDYVMRLQTDCRRRTTNSAVTVTVTASSSTTSSDHSCCQPNRLSSHRRCCQLL